MKKAFLTTALACALSAWLAAQTTPTTSTSTSTPQGTTPTSLTGCLSGGQNGMYTLRTLDSGQVYTLRSANPLASHAGHAVTVTGSLDTANTASSTTTGTMPSTSSTGAATTPNASTPNSGTGATGAATTGTSTGTTAGASGAGTTAGTSNPAGMNPPTAGTTGAAGTSAPVSGGASPVFNVTSISMANESCEAGSAAIGTGTPTDSTAGVTTTGQSTTASSMGSRSTSSTSTTAGTTSTSAGASQTSTNSGNAGSYGAQSTTASGSTNTAGAVGETISGCLLASTRDQGRYFLRTTKGKKFVTEVIPSTEMATNFSDHLGHQVRLTGQFTDATARALDNSTNASSTTAGNASANNPDTTMTAQAGTLPQSDQPARGKKAHERDRHTERQFTATNLEMISASGCPQSSTAPNSGRAKRNRGTSGSTTPDQQR